MQLPDEVLSIVVHNVEQAVELHWAWCRAWMTSNESKYWSGWGNFELMSQPNYETVLFDVETRFEAMFEHLVVSNRKHLPIWLFVKKDRLVLPINKWLGRFFFAHSTGRIFDFWFAPLNSFWGQHLLNTKNHNIQFVECLKAHARPSSTHKTKTKLIFNGQLLEDLD